MNKFIAILSDRVIGEDLLPSRTAGQRVVTLLRGRGAHKVVPLLPHVVLFDFEGGKAEAFRFLSQVLLAQDQVLVFEIGVDYTGVVPLEVSNLLVKFFES